MKKIQNYTIFLILIKNGLIYLLKMQNNSIEFSLKLEASYNRLHIKNLSQNKTFKILTRVFFTDSDIGEIIDEMFIIILTEDVYILVEVVASHSKKSTVYY